MEVDKPLKPTNQPTIILISSRLIYFFLDFFLICPAEIGVRLICRQIRYYLFESFHCIQIIFITYRYLINKTIDKSVTLLIIKKSRVDITLYSNIKGLQTEYGSEFTSKNFEILLIENRIKQQKSPYYLYQNGSVKYSWKTLFLMVSCLHIESKQPKNLWIYALFASAYFRNHCSNIFQKIIT